MKRVETALVVCFALLLAACGDSGAGADTTTSSADPTTSATIVPTITTETVMPNESDLIDAAVADLAGRLGVGEEAIDVLRVEAITWPDGSLGCPEEGKIYTQALVEGSRIILGHQERVYVYHTGGDETPFLCPSDERDGGYDFIPPPGSGES